VAFFPDNQLGQEIDVINSVKLGVIDLMVSGSSIAANLVPVSGPMTSATCFHPFRNRPRRSTPAPPRDRTGAAQGSEYPHHRLGL